MQIRVSGFVRFNLAPSRRRMTGSEFDMTRDILGGKFLR
jgi:hypothetical protein